MTSRDVARRIEKLGATWEPAKGSHRIYRSGDCRTIVPMHPGDLPMGTLRSVEQAMEPCFGKGWLKGR